MENTIPCWKPCMRSKTWNNRGVALLILSFLILCWAVGLSVYVAMEEASIITKTVAISIILAFGVGQLLSYSCVFVIERRKYQMNEEGITVRYGRHIQKFYPWTMFRNIVVCDFDHAPKFPPNCFVIIRLSTFEEPHGPYSKKQKYRLSGVETWRGYHYMMRNCTRILFFEYSPALLDEMKHLSNLRVAFLLTKYGKAKM